MRPENRRSTSVRAPSQPVDCDHDPLPVVLRVRPGAGALFALIAPSAGADRLEKPGGRRTSRLASQSSPPGVRPAPRERATVPRRELVEDVGRENDRKPFPVAAVSGPGRANSRGASWAASSLIEGVERTECERLGRVIGNEEISAGSQRGNSRHPEAAAKLQHTPALHDLRFARDLRRQGDPLGHSSAQYGKFCSGSAAASSISRSKSTGREIVNAPSYQADRPDRRAVARRGERRQKLASSGCAETGNAGLRFPREGTGYPWPDRRRPT